MRTKLEQNINKKYIIIMRNKSHSAKITLKLQNPTPMETSNRKGKTMDYLCFAIKTCLIMSEDEE